MLFYCYSCIVILFNLFYRNGKAEYGYKVFLYNFEVSKLLFLYDLFRKLFVISLKFVQYRFKKCCCAVIRLFTDFVVKLRLHYDDKLKVDLFELRNNMVLDLFESGELITGSLNLVSSSIYPCLVITLSFPANFSKKLDLIIDSSLIFLSLIFIKYQNQILYFFYYCLIN